MRSEALRRIGALDEKLWAYAEDSDWCFRARAAGWKCGVVPRAQMLHAVSSAFSRMKAGTAYLVTRNSLELIRRHRVGAWPLSLLLYIFVVLAWRQLLALLRLDFELSAAQWKGMLDFARRRWGAP
jgi:GT2 family glycosyltransferase